MKQSGFQTFSASLDHFILLKNDQNKVEIWILGNPDFGD